MLVGGERKAGRGGEGGGGESPGGDGVDEGDGVTYGDGDCWVKETKQLGIEVPRR